MADAVLTPKQLKVLEFIEQFRAEKGYAPSQHEIAQHFGFQSLGTVQNYLVRLERQGALQKSWNARRGIQLLKTPPSTTHPAARQGSSIRHDSRDGSGTVPIPLLGRVAAGRPIEAIETPESIEVPASMLRQGEHFVLKVSGSSMIEDGILDGDFAVIKKQADAQNGQTVVALIGNEATIKRFYRMRDRVELHPANPAFKPIVVESMVESDFRIEGVLAGVIRKMAV
ncbi:MAG: transcriptional repressor LexA [Bacteriovoracia bacterium]